MSPAQPWHRARVSLLGHTHLGVVRYQKDPITGGLNLEDGSYVGPGAVFRIEPVPEPKAGDPTEDELRGLEIDLAASITVSSAGWQIQSMHAADANSLTIFGAIGLHVRNLRACHNEIVKTHNADYVKAKGTRDRLAAVIAAERGVWAPTGWKWTTCWERTYAEQGIRVAVRPAMAIVGCGWVWEALSTVVSAPPLFMSAEGDSNWSALEAIENAEAEMKRRYPDLAKEDDDDIPF